MGNQNFKSQGLRCNHGWRQGSMRVAVLADCADCGRRHLSDSGHHGIRRHSMEQFGRDAGAAHCRSACLHHLRHLCLYHVGQGTSEPAAGHLLHDYHDLLFFWWRSSSWSLVVWPVPTAATPTFRCTIRPAAQAGSTFSRSPLSCCLPASLERRRPLTFGECCAKRTRVATSTCTWPRRPTKIVRCHAKK